MIYRVFMTDEDYVVIDADSSEEAILKLRDAVGFLGSSSAQVSVKNLEAFRKGFSR